MFYCLLFAILLNDFNCASQLKTLSRYDKCDQNAVALICHKGFISFYFTTKSLKDFIYSFLSEKNWNRKQRRRPWITFYINILSLSLTTASCFNLYLAFYFLLSWLFCSPFLTVSTVWVLFFSFMVTSSFLLFELSALAVWLYENKCNF